MFYLGETFTTKSKHLFKGVLIYVLDVKINRG